MDYHIFGMSWHSCTVNMVGKKEFESGRRLFVGMIWEAEWNCIAGIIIHKQSGEIGDPGCLVIQMDRKCKTEMET